MLLLFDAVGTFVRLCFTGSHSSLGVGIVIPSVDGDRSIDESSAASLSLKSTPIIDDDDDIDGVTEEEDETGGGLVRLFFTPDTVADKAMPRLCQFTEEKDGVVDVDAATIPTASVLTLDTSIFGTTVTGEDDLLVTIDLTSGLTEFLSVDFLPLRVVTASLVSVPLPFVLALNIKDEKQRDIKRWINSDKCTLQKKIHSLCVF